MIKMENDALKENIAKLSTKLEPLKLKMDDVKGPQKMSAVVIKCRVHFSIILSFIKYLQRLCYNKSDQNINCKNSFEVLKFKNGVEARNNSKFAKLLETKL